MLAQCSANLQDIPGGADLVGELDEIFSQQTAKNVAIQEVIHKLIRCLTSRRACELYSSFVMLRLERACVFQGFGVFFAGKVESILVDFFTNRFLVSNRLAWTRIGSRLKSSLPEKGNVS